MNIILRSVFFLSAMAVIPAVPVMLCGKASTEEKSSGAAIKEYIFEEETTSDEPYKVLCTADGTINEVSVRDYVIGAVAAEIPALFEVEAIKAQAAAAHTYAERQRILQKRSPDPALGGADFSDDPSKYQGFFTDKQIRHYFGDNYDIHYEKIASAVDEVLPYIITYNDEPIISAFHSMSSGTTESAEYAWGTAVDYLVPVDSNSDVDAPGYTDTAVVSSDFIKARFEKVIPGLKLGEDPKKWFEIAEISPSGTVLSVMVGDKEVTGGDIREALNLRSADFTIDYSDGEFTFTTHGYGHGVGMSQYGANSMALEGATWQDIIKHYYPGAEIS